MNAPAYSLPSSYFHNSSSRTAKYGTKRFLGGTVLLLFLLVLTSSAFAQVRLTPSALSFGNQVVNQSSTAMSAALKNTQAVPLSISIAISGGTAPADYVAGGNCPVSPSTLGPGENCNITVTFTPSALGIRTATLTVTDNAGANPLTVALTGMGVAAVDLAASSGNFGAVAVANTSATPSVTLTDQRNLVHGRPLNSGGNAGLPVVSPVGTVPSPISVSLPVTASSPVSVSPASLTFASGAVGTTSSARTVTLTNHQNTSLTISAAVATGDFAVASNTCGSSVASGRSCIVGVTFRPTAMGVRTGALTLPYSAAGSPSVIALSGTGNANGLLSIAVTPANPSVALGQTQQFTATGLFSSGLTQNLTASVTWSSSAAGVATINAAGLATSVAPGSTTITATFTGAGLATGVRPDTPIVNPPPVPPVLPPPISSITTISGSTTLTVTSDFVLTGSLNTARSEHTATLLNNGLVLIAGGYGPLSAAGYGPLGSAELYNPASGTFTATGTLNAPRYQHTATLLDNGMVLIAGGQGGASGYVILGSAELYNPATGIFTSTGSLTTPRYQHTATLLPSGMVLMAGGRNVSGNQYVAVASAELYNPATETFTPTGSLDTAREEHTATLLNNGLVLIAGGYGSSGALGSAELYNPATGTFSYTTGGPSVGLNTARYLHTATLLNNGLVLMAGGSGPLGGGGYGPLASAELYNPANGTFTPTGNLTIVRTYDTATLLNNGLVLVAAGESVSSNQILPVASAELYNPDTGTFAATGNLTTPRTGHTATLLSNGLVLVAGGGNSSGYVASAELYEPATLTPPNLVSISLAPSGPTVPLDSALRFIATGTFSGGSTEQLAEVTWSSSNPGVISISNDSSDPGAAYAAASGSATVSACAGAVCGSTTVTVRAGLVSIAITPVGQALAPGQSVQFAAAGTFDDGPPQDITSSVTWSSSALSVATINAGGLASALSPGSTTITAASGAVQGSATLTVMGFVLTGSLTTARYEHTATLLNNGLVLIAGGCCDSDGNPFPSAELYNPAAGTLTSTGSLNTARYEHTATLLNNGLVLIAGGCCDVNGNPFPSAELYNPATGTFTPTGSLSTARNSHTATLLSSGLVLMAGGYGLYGTLDSAELYNPATGTFTPTGSLNAARYDHTATLLDNGLVLMAGGYNDGYIGTAELYNPTTGTFTATATLNTARYAHTATLLNNGLVLIAGGYISDSPYRTASAELFNPATGTFTPTGSLNNARFYHTATLLNNGLVLMANGCCDVDYNDLTSAELYNPTTGTFTFTASLNYARDTATATLLNNGMVLIAAGENSNEVLQPSAELYQPATLTPPNLVSISLAPSSPTVPLGTALRFTATGTFSGGVTEQLAEVTWSSSDPEVISITDDASNLGAAYAAAAGAATVSACAGAVCGSTTVTVGPPGLGSITGTAAFALTASLNTPRALHTATLLNNGLVLMAGGVGQYGLTLASAELYDPATGTFTPTGSLNTARSAHTATLLNNGLVLMAGGIDPYGNTLANAELYNPATGTFSYTTGGPGVGLNTARHDHTATLLPSGLVLIAGGNNDGALVSAELYNPATGTFTPTGSLNTGRYGHTATLLSSGTVLIAGGYNGSGAFASAELYNPATETFSYTTGGPGVGLNTARVAHTATLLNNGMVLIAGGLDVNSNLLASAELYNPATGTFSYTTGGPGVGLNTARFRHTATLLNNGMVLIAGGLIPARPYITASAELYNPASGTFAYTGSLNNARYDHTATLLPSGRVLLAGGLDVNANFFATAELYAPATLTPPNLVSISLAPNSPTVPLGTALRFTATGTFSGDSTEQLASLTWSSSNPGVISITDDGSNAGAAYAAAGGSATVSACAGAVCGATKVTVGPRLLSLTVTPADATLAPGLSVQFYATGISSNGSSQDLTSSVAWISSVPSVAAINAGGLATGMTAGTTTITADSGEVQGSATLTVMTGPVLTGSLSTPRALHTATMLNNGLVLIAGGYNSSGYLASAELYNPATGTFTATGSMNTARIGHTATLLNNGVVLIAGGYGSSTYLHSAELYDPVAQTFTPTTGMLNGARVYDTATLLASGMVLIAGGYSGTARPHAELYDPTTQTFTLLSVTLNTARYWHTATLLNDGMVLLAGGRDVNNNPLGSAELYDPANAYFFPVTGSLSTARYLHTATLLNNGMVLMAGGLSSSAASLASGELYDPGPGLFLTTGSLNAARVYHTATLLNNGQVLIAGGEDSSGFLASAELYDPATAAFAAAGTLNSARGAPTATLLASGQVLIAGGLGSSGYFTGAELYEPATLTPPELESITITPATATLSPGTTQQFIATGTFSDNSTEQLPAVTWSSSCTNCAQISNDVTNPGLSLAIAPGPTPPTNVTITATAGSVSSSATLTVRPTGFVYTGSLNNARSSHTATLLNNGLVLIAGGAYWNGSSSVATASAELYNPATGTFTPTGSMSTARENHTATLLNDGEVLIAGGQYWNGSSFVYTATAELYLPPPYGFFTPVSNMTTARVNHTATLLPDGTVLIAGGSSSASPYYLASAEVYNPATFTFTATGSMSTPRTGHTATLLNNGVVLMAGGYIGASPFVTASAELYVPTAGPPSPSGSFYTLPSELITARFDHTATLLSNGAVLIAGGMSWNGSSFVFTASAELFSPATMTFTATGGLKIARFADTATLLNNGMVLLAGGDGFSGILNSAELYNPATGTFSYTPGGPNVGLNTAREHHTATLLTNGMVLLAGGDGFSGILNSAELY
jgi:hypothetical protein